MISLLARKPPNLRSAIARSLIAPLAFGAGGAFMLGFASLLGPLPQPNDHAIHATINP